MRASLSLLSSFSRCPLLLFPLCHLQSTSPSLCKPVFHSWSIFLSLKMGRVSQRRAAEEAGRRRRRGYALCKTGPRSQKSAGWDEVSALHGCTDVWMRRNQTRHSTDRRGLERWNQHARREQLYIGVKVLPSLPLPPSLFPFLFLFFGVCCRIYLFISFPVFLHLQLSASPLRVTEGTAVTNREPQK